MQRLQQYLTSFKHKIAKACPSKQCDVPLYSRGHFKKCRGTTPTIRSGATAQSIYRSTVKTLTTCGLLFCDLSVRNLN